MTSRFELQIVLFVVFLLVSCSEPYKLQSMENSLSIGAELGHSGVYGNLILAVDGKQITGFYSNFRGEYKRKAPEFSCVFYFRGKFEFGKYQIIAQYPPGNQEDQIMGILNFAKLDGKAAVFMKLEKEPPGCANVEPFEFKKGQEFIQTEKGDWKEIRLIQSEKVHLYSFPDMKSRTRKYLVRYDPVRVYQVRNDWVEVEFEDGKQNTKGWLRKEDLYELR